MPTPDLPSDPAARRGKGRRPYPAGTGVSRNRVGPAARTAGRADRHDGPFVLAAGLTTPGEIPLLDAVELACADLERQRVAGNLLPLTVYATVNHARRFARYSQVHGVRTLAALDVETCELCIRSPNAPGDGAVRLDGRPGPATVATWHSRRAYLRALLRTLRVLGLFDKDPTRDILLPPRAPGTGRAATAEEVLRCQDASRKTVDETRLPCALALVLVGHSTSETPYTTTADVHLAERLVWAHDGGAKAAPRWLPLDDWGTEQVACRLDWLAGHPGPAHEKGARGLVYTPRSADPPHHIRHGAGSRAISEVIRLAGLSREPGFRPLSLQQYVAEQVWEQTGRLESVAARLGLTSLDAVADLLDVDWRDAFAIPGPTGHPGPAGDAPGDDSRTDR